MSYYRGYPTDFIFLPSIFNSGAPRKTPECMPSSDSDAESERRNHWQARQHGGPGESPPHALHERGHSQQGQPMYAIHGKPKTGQTDLRAQGRGVGGNGERDMRSISGIMDKFCLMIWVVVTQTHTPAKAHRLIPLASMHCDARNVHPFKKQTWGSPCGWHLVILSQFLDTADLYQRKRPSQIILYTLQIKGPPA